MAKQLYALPTTTVLTIIYGIILIVSCQAAESKDPKKEAITARPDPWDRQTLPPQPRAGYYKFLGDCIDKLTKPCGLQIFDSIYGKAIIDKPCCQKITEMGQLCSKSLSLTLSQIEKYKSDAKLIIKKSDEAFDKCVKDTTSKTK